MKLNDEIAALQKKIGSRFRAERMRLGFSQDEYAAQIGMHRTYYSAIERGEKNLTVGTIVRVCKGLQMLHNELFE